MKILYSTSASLALATAMLAFLPTSAVAQATAADTDVVETGDIIVTASKRAENVQDVPVAVQVISGQALEAQGVRDFNDLTRIAPSLVIRPESQPATAAISIRGIGTYAFGIGVEPSVTVQVDDVPVTVQARAFADLQDIERIEVLRGPQSTLYGKAAIAGLINIYTQQPSDKFSVRVNGFGTTDSEFGGGATISGPIGDNVGYRLTSSYVDYRGNVRDILQNKWVNGRKVFTARGKIVWDGPQGVKATLSANVIDGQINAERPFIRLSPSARLRGVATETPAVFAPGIVPSATNYITANNGINLVKYSAFGQSLKLEYEFDKGPTLMSITSNDFYKFRDQQDHDETASPNIVNQTTGTFTAKGITQEIRLLAPGKDRFRYTLGFFFAAGDQTRSLDRGPAYALARWNATSKSEQIAVFGQFDFSLFPTTTLIGGVRLQQENIKYTFLDRQNGNAFFQGGSKDSFSTYRLGIRQEVSDDVSLFATYATGHKGETFDLTTGFNLNRQLAGPVKPETARSVEGGIRAQFFDRKLTFNATVFHANYRDFQSQGIEFLPDGTQNFRLTNVGKVRTQGVEFEVFARPTSDLNLTGSVAYLDAEIAEFPGAQCYPGQTAAQGCVGTPARQNLKGFRPANAPEWKATAGFDFSPELGGSGLRGVVQGNWTYQSTVNYSLNQDPETIQKGYSLVNAGVGIRSADRQYEVMLYVNNLFDKQYYGNLFNQSGNFGNNQATLGFLSRDFRRYGGIRASINF